MRPGVKIGCIDVALLMMFHLNQVGPPNLTPLIGIAPPIRNDRAYPNAAPTIDPIIPVKTASERNIPLTVSA